VPAGSTFDFDAFISAVQARRRQRGLSWMELATVLWDQSDELNRHRNDHPL
jgi:hypothetical protein